MSTIPTANQDEGLGKSINDYLNHYVLVADGKAVAVIASSFILAGLVLSKDSRLASSLAAQVSVLADLIAAAFAIFAVFLRTPHGSVGHIFWADIANFQSAEHYWQSLRGLGVDEIGREYARQNFFVSQVLLKKNRVLRIALISLIASVVSLMLAFWPQ